MSKLHILSAYRVFTLTKYYFICSFRNISRVLLIAIWPIIDLIIWGFTASYFGQTQVSVNPFVGIILSSIIFWTLTIKAQQEISCQFMDDVYSRNFSNLITSPITSFELILSLTLSNLIKLQLVFFSLLASSTVFFSFNLFNYNRFVAIYAIINLIIFGWVLGITAIALIIRFGYRLEVFAWSLSIFIQPVSCVFYPRSILPEPLKILSFLNPISYVFEEFRGLINNNSYSIDKLHIATLINIIYIIGASILFVIMLNQARKKGSLLRL